MSWGFRIKGRARCLCIIKSFCMHIPGNFIRIKPRIVRQVQEERGAPHRLKFEEEKPFSSPPSNPHRHKLYIGFEESTWISQQHRWWLLLFETWLVWGRLWETVSIIETVRYRENDSSQWNNFPNESRYFVKPSMAHLLIDFKWIPICGEKFIHWRSMLIRTIHRHPKWTAAQNHIFIIYKIRHAK